MDDSGVVEQWLNGVPVSTKEKDTKLGEKRDLY